MKTFVPAGLALALLATAAHGQTPPPPMSPPSTSAPAADMRPAGPAKSARFRLQVGHIFLGMTCPDDEPMKACGELAMQLLDKAESLQKQ